MVATRRHAAVAAAAVGYVVAVPGVLVSIIQQLVGTPADVARAGATSRAWRQAANSEQIWRLVCESTGVVGLGMKLKARLAGFCQLSWRQLYVQRTLADHNHDRESPVRPEFPPRSDYLIGIELCREASCASVFSSVCELSSADDSIPDDNPRELFQVPQHECSTCGFTYNTRGTNDPPLLLRMYIIRKKDGKMFSLAQDERYSRQDDDDGADCLIYCTFLCNSFEANIDVFAIVKNVPRTGCICAYDADEYFECDCAAGGALTKLEEIRAYLYPEHESTSGAMVCKSVGQLLAQLESPKCAHRWA